MPQNILLQALPTWQSTGRHDSREHVEVYGSNGERNGTIYTQTISEFDSFPPTLHDMLW